MVVVAVEVVVVAVAVAVPVALISLTVATLPPSPVTVKYRGPEAEISSSFSTNAFKEQGTEEN
ncbi:hypothetical protein [Metabacillus sp. 84]|uniref:hypothetical protein n=1 Tax=Metabacillus sp. 84 TaxID=3404705 RepID=UPI003CFB827E